MRKKKRRKKISLLTVAESNYSLVIGWSFHAKIKASVVAMTVLVILAVRFIVLVVV